MGYLSDGELNDLRANNSMSKVNCEAKYPKISYMTLLGKILLVLVSGRWNVREVIWVGT